MEAPRVVHECDSWMVVHKPSGMHTIEQRSSTGKQITLEGWLRESFTWTDAVPESGIVHRLDLLTSGAVLVAKSIDEHQRLRIEISNPKAIGKVYLALARSGLDDRSTFDLFFTSRYRRSKRVTVREQGEPQHRGCCDWTVARREVMTGREDERSYDLVIVTIRGPGRRHQIRAGLAYLGHPLHGDPIYGTCRDESSCDGRESAHAGMFGLHSFAMQIDDALVFCDPPSCWPAQPDEAVKSMTKALLQST